MPDPLAAWNDGQSLDDLSACTLAMPACAVCVPLRVIDGDTIEMACERGKVEEVRLHGVDAPEIGGRQSCAREGEIGYQAKLFAEKWLLPGGRAIVRFVTKRDRFGRRIGMITYRGRDLGSDLVIRGLAKPWGWGEPKPSWCD